MDLGDRGDGRVVVPLLLDHADVGGRGEHRPEGGADAAVAVRVRGRVVALHVRLDVAGDEQPSGLLDRDRRRRARLERRQLRVTAAVKAVAPGAALGGARRARNLAERALVDVVAGERSLLDVGAGQRAVLGLDGADRVGAEWLVRVALDLERRLVDVVAGQKVVLYVPCR